MINANDMFPVGSSDADLVVSSSDAFDLDLDLPAMNTIKKNSSSSNDQSLSLVQSLMMSFKKEETNVSEAFPTLIKSSKSPVKIEEETKKTEKKTVKKAGTKKPRKERKWKKPKDKPKRPLSAYNFFFADEREKMVNAANKVNGSSTGGFGGMAKTVAARWNTLTDVERTPYEAAAKVEKDKYFAALEVWKLKKANEVKQQQEQPVTSTPVPVVTAAASKAAVETPNAFPALDEPIPFETSSSFPSSLSSSLNNELSLDLQSILQMSCNLLDQLPVVENILDDTPLEATMGSQDGSDPILDELVAYCFDGENENNFMKDLQF